MIVANSEPANYLDIQNLKWALRTGKMEALENGLAGKQAITTAELRDNIAEQSPVCTTALDQNKSMEKMINQELKILRNEFAVFIKSQVNHETALKLFETEWKQKLSEHESKMLAELWEMRQSIIGEYTTYFQLIVEQLKNWDYVIQKEISLIKEQLHQMHQYQDSHKGHEVSGTNEWKQKSKACEVLSECCSQLAGKRAADAGQELQGEQGRNKRKRRHRRG